MIISVHKINIESFVKLLSLISIIIIAYITGNNHIEFLAVTMGIILIVIIAKYSYFSVFSFILWFSFLQEYFASINRSLSSGRLLWDVNVPVYFKELFICTAFFFIFEIFIFSVTNVLKNEKDIYRRKIFINIKWAYVLAIVSLIIIILCYPTLPKTGMLLERDNGFISSSLFVPISMFLLGITVDYIKSSLLIKIITVADVFWVVMHGDRVIVLGFIVYVLLKYLNNDNSNKKAQNKFFNKKLMISFMTAIAIITIAIKVQYTRAGVDYSYNFTDFIMNILKQGTAADVVHCFNCATKMWISGEGLYGYTYLHYILNLLPKANISLNPAIILMEKYNTLGGGLFFSEPMMNGGLILCILHSMIFILILTWLFNKKSDYRCLLIIPFIILIFRFAWYSSLAGIVKMVFYYVPIIYLITKKVRI
ncbi:MAG: hypothetical protein JTJ28_13575 [Lactobacillus sp.]|nr:hypothetical protein [Lactobacillus sp.]